MNELLALLQIKKIIALSLTLVFVILSIKGGIDAQSFLTVFLVIIGFYFGQSTVKDSVTGIPSDDEIKE